MPYVWKPAYGARIGVMPLGGPTSAIRWVEIEPCYVFHGINVCRDGDDVVLDVCRLTNGLRTARRSGPRRRLHRWRINTAGSQLTFHDELRSDRDRRAAVDRQASHRTRLSPRLARADAPRRRQSSSAGSSHIDAVHRHRDAWDPGPQYASGEWLFVPTGPSEARGRADELRVRQGTRSSELVVLDARDVGAGPLARVALPQRVPYGFHAAWVPSQPV